MKGIRLLNIAVTWRCNLKCRTCSIWKRPENKQSMMDLDALFKELEHDFYDSVTIVNWFGGEPTLHPGLARAVAWARHRFPQAYERALVTNGYHAMPTLEAIAREDPDLLVCFSLDGFQPIHDRRRGRIGVYDEVLRGIIFVSEHFSKKPRLSVTLLPGDLEGWRQAWLVAEHYGCEVAVRPAVSGSYFGAGIQADWTEEEIAKLEILMTELPEKAKGNIEFTKALSGFLKSGTHRPCAAKGLTGVIEPDLGFRICHSHPEKIPLGTLPSNWTELVSIAEKQDCFKPGCFIDGPYSLSYLSPEHAPWLK